MTSLPQMWTKMTSAFKSNKNAKDENDFHQSENEIIYSKYIQVLYNAVICELAFVYFLIPRNEKYFFLWIRTHNNQNEEVYSDLVFKFILKHSEHDFCPRRLLLLKNGFMIQLKYFFKQVKITFAFIHTTPIIALYTTQDTYPFLAEKSKSKIRPTLKRTLFFAYLGFRIQFCIENFRKHITSKDQ